MLSNGRHVRALNAGVDGGDLLYSYMILRDLLTDLSPDLVIAAVNASDIGDVIVRGGMERFQPDGTVRARRGPSWEWLYGISYITRHVVRGPLHHDAFLLRPADHTRAEEEAADALRSAIESLARLAADRGARFVVVFHPTEGDVRSAAYVPSAFDMLAQKAVSAQSPPAVDLLRTYARSGALTPANSGDYYWPLDYPHNASGYALMGRTIAETIRDLGVLESTGVRD